MELPPRDRKPFLRIGTVGREKYVLCRIRPGVPDLQRSRMPPPKATRRSGVSDVEPFTAPEKLVAIRHTKGRRPLRESRETEQDQRDYGIPRPSYRGAEILSWGHSLIHTHFVDDVICEESRRRQGEAE